MKIQDDDNDRSSSGNFCTAHNLRFRVTLRFQTNSRKYFYLVSFFPTTSSYRSMFARMKAALSPGCFHSTILVWSSPSSTSICSSSISCFEGRNNKMENFSDIELGKIDRNLEKW